MHIARSVRSLPPRSVAAPIIAPIRKPVKGRRASSSLERSVIRLCAASDHSSIAKRARGLERRVANAATRRTRGALRLR
jgi:hypothetical protein